MKATREINRELVNEKEQHLLERMLGVGSRTKKKMWGYRNRFIATIECVPWFVEMEKRGLVRSHLLDFETTKPHFCFTATELGCKAIGLHKAAIKRAME